MKQTLIILLLLTLSSCTSKQEVAEADCQKLCDEKIREFQETVELPLLYKMGGATVFMTDEIYIAAGKDSILFNDVIYIRK